MQLLVQPFVVICCLAPLVLAQSTQSSSVPPGTSGSGPAVPKYPSTQPETFYPQPVAPPRHSGTTIPTSNDPKRRPSAGQKPSGQTFFTTPGSMVPPKSQRAFPVNFPPVEHVAPPGPSMIPGPAIPNDQSPKRLVDAAQVVAVVGNQLILAGDLEGEINQLREQYQGKVSDEEFDVQRPKLRKQLLKQHIDTKLVYHDFLKNIPAENHSIVLKTINQQFNEKQLERTLNKYEVETVAELEAKLRSYGSSLQKLKRQFAEQVVSHQMIRQQSDDDEEITHDEMLKYYWEHIPDYQFPAKTLWEELTTEYRHYKNETLARQELAVMGNEVLRGAPLNAVARRSRQGPRWEKGGQHEWTNKDSLRSKELDIAIFTLPIGKLSQIIRDADGYHIVRVIQRVDAGRVPFIETQTKIKEKIKADRRNQQVKDYLVHLREGTKVWTIYDADNQQRVSETGKSSTFKRR
ncbi:MAG: hypothetical protein CMJ62_05665 [Planctomycetaceae bacterium]|nr:hypothetical protein [Planctomycetaceae bacterium]